MRQILVVGDHLHIGQTIGTWLNHRDFRVLTADRGTSGLTALDHGTFAVSRTSAAVMAHGVAAAQASSKSPDGTGGASLEVRRFGERPP